MTAAKRLTYAEIVRLMLDVIEMTRDGDGSAVEAFLRSTDVQARRMADEHAGRAYKRAVEIVREAAAGTLDPWGYDGSYR